MLNLTYKDIFTELEDFEENLYIDCPELKAKVLSLKIELLKLQKLAMIQYGIEKLLSENASGWGA